MLILNKFAVLIEKLDMIFVVYYFFINLKMIFKNMVHVYLQLIWWMKSTPFFDVTSIFLIDDTKYIRSANENMASTFLFAWELSYSAIVLYYSSGFYEFKLGFHIPENVFFGITILANCFLNNCWFQYIY